MISICVPAVLDLLLLAVLMQTVSSYPPEHPQRFGRRLAVQQTCSCQWVYFQTGKGEMKRSAVESI